MHELFTKVLAKRDLSRAGDLFSVADTEIVADLNEVVSAGHLSSLILGRSNYYKQYKRNVCTKVISKLDNYLGLLLGYIILREVRQRYNCVAGCLCRSDNRKH